VGVVEGGGGGGVVAGRKRSFEPSAGPGSHKWGRAPHRIVPMPKPEVNIAGPVRVSFWPGIFARRPLSFPPGRPLKAAPLNRRVL